MSELSDPTTPVTVSLRTPADLVASVPALLGFVPQRSLVAIAMLRHENRQRLGAMCRIDLPEDTEQAAAFAEAMVARLATSDPAWVQLVVIADQPQLPGLGAPPEAGLVEIVAATFAAEGIDTPGPLWVARVEPGALWRCYELCGCAGAVPDPGATTMAAHTALLGRVTYRSRDEAASALAPTPEAESPQRRALLDAAYRDAGSARVADPVAAARGDVDAIRAAIATTAAGDTLEETVLARVVAVLADPAVRDVCLGFAAGRDPAVDPAAAEELWWQLTRATPAPEVAEPATLLAFATLRHGGGVTLSVALEHAMRADPAHQLSRLLGQIVNAGMRPDVIEDMVLGASAEAERRYHQ